MLGEDRKGSLVQTESLQTMLNYITKAQYLTTALLSLIKKDCKLANGNNSVRKVVFLVEISSVVLAYMFVKCSKECNQNANTVPL